MTLGLATIGGDLPGSTDLVFTFNDGDPSGLVFGSGATLLKWQDEQNRKLFLTLQSVSLG